MERISAMYRRALRLTREIEGQRRRRVCVFRTRQAEMLSRAIQDSSHSQRDGHLMDADLYLDNIEAQAKHLRSLDPDKLLIPVDLYHSTQTRRVVLDSCTARRRTEEERVGNVREVLGGKLFSGPEPSWIRNRTKQKGS